MSDETSVETADGSTEEAPEIIENLNEQPEETQEAEPEGSGPKETGETPGLTDEQYSKKVQERIAHLTSEKLSERQARIKAEAELKEYREAAGSKPEIPDISKYQDEYGETDMATYNQDMAAYHESLIVYHDSQKEFEQAKAQDEADSQTKWESFNTAAEGIRAKYSDFDEVINRPVFQEQLSNVLIENNMAEVAYYLGNNEAEARKLNQMSLLQMSKELGKLEGKLLSMPSQSSQAPEPITPVSDEKGLSMSEPGISDDDWLKKAERERLQKIKEKLGA